MSHPPWDWECGEVEGGDDVSRYMSGESPAMGLVTNLYLIVISAYLKFADISFFHLNGLWGHKPWHILLMSGEPPAKGEYLVPLMV